MKRRVASRRAGLALALAVGATLPGCDFLRWVFPVSVPEEELWEDDRIIAQLLANRLAGEKGYYAGDAALNPEARGKLEANLNMLLGTLKGPYSNESQRRDLEARLAAHAKPYLAYVDKDSRFTPTEKAEMKMAVEQWLRRIGVTP